MKIKKGFSWVEIVIVLAMMAGIAALFMIQKNNLEAMNRDEVRKTAINAMYYALEKDFYPENGYYPEVIGAEVLPVVMEDLWTDPDGNAMGLPQSNYRYTPANCNNGKCQEYRLEADLEKEDTFILYNEVKSAE